MQKTPPPHPPESEDAYMVDVGDLRLAFCLFCSDGGGLGGTPLATSTDPRDLWRPRTMCANCYVPLKVRL